MTLPRNRNVGSLRDTDCELTTDLPSLHSKQRRSIRKRKLPEPMPKIKAELIKGRKLGQTSPGNRTEIAGRYRTWSTLERGLGGGS
jgi:hypothetical protein